MKIETMKPTNYTYPSASPQTNETTKMKTKNYTVTHIASGDVRHHAGVSPAQLTSGEISAERIAAGYHTPAMDWSPDPLQWRVEEATAPAGSTPAKM